MSPCNTRAMTLETGQWLSLPTSAQPMGCSHLYGDQTGLLQPHGVWIDHSRELLYIANTHAGNILVYENAYQVDGNRVPSRIITSSFMQEPAHIFVDEATDRMFVANCSDELRLDPNLSYPDDGG